MFEIDKLSELLFILQLFEASTVRDTTQYLKLNKDFEFQIGTLVFDKDGFIKPVSSSDADAPNNSVYYSTTASKLVYKSPAGVVNSLY